jgi:hypothetical protein
MPEHIVVSSYEDLERASRPSDRACQRVATIFSEQSWDYVLWIPEWLLEEPDKEITTVQGSDHLAVAGDVEDYSQKAWRLWQKERIGTDADLEGASAFLPKSSVVVFERGVDVDVIETPQQGLTEFADG